MRDNWLSNRVFDSNNALLPAALDGSKEGSGGRHHRAGDHCDAVGDAKDAARDATAHPIKTEKAAGSGLLC
jgi:hypothetical protein